MNKSTVNLVTMCAPGPGRTSVFCIPDNVKYDNIRFSEPIPSDIISDCYLLINGKRVETSFPSDDYIQQIDFDLNDVHKKRNALIYVNWSITTKPYNYDNLSVNIDVYSED